MQPFCQDWLGIINYNKMQPFCQDWLGIISLYSLLKILTDIMYSNRATDQ